MNRITFCSHPDIVQGPAVALTNYTNDTIKQILNACEQEKIFYLIDADNPNEWLNKVYNQVIITHDCSTTSVEKILDNGKK
jgi:NAD(P)H-hydrate repair Nnr-like enzyme with NAD(P)H-hydrate dehydratase domain